jgi:hypothetical protein
MPRKSKPVILSDLEDFVETDPEMAVREGPGYVWNRLNHRPFDVLSAILLVAAFTALGWALFVIV